MNKFLKTVDTNKIDMDTISDVVLAEALSTAVSATKENCILINKKINFLTLQPYIPKYSDSSLELYDYIIELIFIKNRLIAMYKLLSEWYTNLSDKDKQLYVACFIKKDKKLCRKITGDTGYYTRKVIPMAVDFMAYIKEKTGFERKDFLENPFIYETYLRAIHRNEKQACRRREKMEDNTYDNPTDEECYSQCL